ncbi:MAG: cofactor-independent phosphoglycerate mutase [Methanobrevibacter sp.]|jgi:2,3-bisphosphoglycerate-independent phosphoglycerate mutase|nr:cofactor-independent phosphoglycerate mutase [Candidatus Methanovirga basalitermitum]
MKYVVVIGDGMADWPLNELNMKTPLQVADKPNIDKLTLKGRAGRLQTVPETLNPGSDVANMSIFGYDPLKYYSGRGPLEAGSIKIKLSDDDVVFRCNLITEENGKLISSNAGHITSQEANILMKHLNKSLNNKSNQFGNFLLDEVNKPIFYNGMDYKHLFIIKNKLLSSISMVPPHDIIGKEINSYLSLVDEGKIIAKLILQSKKVLNEHPINKKRIEEGKNPANMIWLWGQGLKPKLPLFKDIYGLKGSVITGVDLLKGMGIFAGLDIINVPGATAFYDTDYKAKGKYAANSLKKQDIQFIHIEAPDEAGHDGNIEEKIKAIERIDKYIVGQILDNINDYDDYKIAILPDHFTPIAIRTHSRDPVPLTIYSTTDIPDEVKVYDEFSVVNGSLNIDKGHNLVKRLL